MLSYLLDAAYLLAAAATAHKWRRKARGDWPQRFGKIDPLPAPARPRLLLHAVSVGEVNLTRPLVDRLLHPPEGSEPPELVLSVTTDTGIARALQLYEGRFPVVRYPLDASWAVRRFLDAVRPDAVALVELEVWPNFMTLCRRRAIPVAVVNGRLSARSFKGYRKARPFLHRFFGKLAFAAVQDEQYASRFREMGVPPDRLTVAGTMKWDAAADASGVDPESLEKLAQAMRIDRRRPLIVAGSTAPDEHALLRDALPGEAQLLCAPRRPEWFDGAARDLPGCVRRSDPSAGTAEARHFLLDTIGELRLAYALADVVVVGRSFGSLHGSDPMEPASLGRPIVIGPAVEDFVSTVDAMRTDGAILQVTRDELGPTLQRLLDDAEERQRLAANARACVERHRGAADVHAGLIRAMMQRVERTQEGVSGG